MSAPADLAPLREAALGWLRTLVGEVFETRAHISPIDLIKTMEQVSSSATAVQAMAIAQMVDEAEGATGQVGAAGRLVPEPEFVPDEIALALRCSSVAAHRRCRLAIDAARHPALMESWAVGVIGPASVAVVAELTAPLEPAVDATYELVHDAVAHAIEHTPSQTRSWLARRAIVADPEAAEVRRRRAFADRKVVCAPGADSMASLWAYLPAVQARQIYDTVNAIALAAGDGDVRTMDQRRADVLVDLLLSRADPSQVSVQVIASASMLAGLSDEPAEVVGVGPVLPSELQQLLSELAAPPSFRLLRVDDDTGGLTAISERQYRPSGPLRRAVEARDLVCRFPGCRRSAAGRGVDLDHTVPWPAGETDAGNLAVLCRRHHRLKHSPGWHVQLDPDGVLSWRTPEGKVFRTAPWVYSDPRAP